MHKPLNLISKAWTLEHKTRYIYDCPKEHARTLLVSTMDSLQNYASQNQVICAKQNTFEQNLHNIKSFNSFEECPHSQLIC